MLASTHSIWVFRAGEIDFDPDGGVLIRVEETEAFRREARSIFAEDGAVKCYDYVDGVCWRHLNVFEHRCDIFCRLPPEPCLKTGKVYRVTPPWEGLSKAFTKAFEARAILLMREMAVCPAARIINETDTQLWRLLRAHVERAWPRGDWSAVSIVGCDELSARKGHRYVRVFCDLVGKRVLFAVEGKDKSVWEKCVAALGEPHGHHRAITGISMDMRPGYIEGADENTGSQARGGDKFHVIAPLSKAMIENHLEGIPAPPMPFWRGEGGEQRFSAVKRKAGGFRSVKNLIPMLYFTAGKLPLSAAP